MEVKLIKRTETGNYYVVRDQAGRPIGQVIWKMAGPDIGQHFYSLDSKYKAARIQKIFRAELR